MSQQQPLPLAEVMPTMMCQCPHHASAQCLEFPPPTVSKKCALIPWKPLCLGLLLSAV